MKILVIGGTQFVGRHFAEAAIRAGHEVTLFHRGSKGTGSITGAQDVLGDRTENLDRVAKQNWDVVMDSSAYTPGVLRQSCDALADRCGRYLFVSTVSVYDTGDQGPTGEDSPLVPLGDPEAKEINAQTYGYLKVLCEREVESVFGDRSFIVRPGIVAGSFDPTNRFTYWVMRFANGGQVLVPNVLESNLQLIDARDLGEFMVSGAEQGLSGAFNAAGPLSNFGEMITTCHSLNPGVESVLTDIEVLENAGVKLWQDLPLAVPPGEDKLFSVSSDKAISKSLGYRKLLDTAQDVIQWKRGTTDEIPPRTGMSRERELEILTNLAN